MKLRDIFEDNITMVLSEKSDTPSILDLIFESLDNNISKEQLIKQYPGIEKDLMAVQDWLKTNNPKYILKYEPMSKWKDQAEHLLSTYPQFPEEKKRTMKILTQLKNRQKPWPIFVDSSNFIMEGRHRIVAFYLHGLTTLPVVYPSV